MRSPPSPARLLAYPVAGGLGLLAIAVTVATGSGRWPIERFEVGPTAFRGEPWRLFTATLPHIGPIHLLFNVYWLWVFGTLLEEVLGHARLLALIALFAVGSMAAEYAIFGGGVGLSGVGYGLFGMLWVLSTRDRRFAGAVDARTVQSFALWFVFCIVSTYLKVFAVANVAHGVGALLGLLVGVTMSEGLPVARRLMAAAGVPAVVVASLLGATVLRPRVNLSHDGHRSFQLGYAAIQEGRLDDAIRDYGDSLAMNPGNAGAWHNLGIAYDGAGRGVEAVAAHRRSFDLDPHNHQHRLGYLQSARQAASAAQEKGDHLAAVDLLRQVLAVEPDDRWAWFHLELSDQALGRADEAQRAHGEVMRLAAPKP